MPVSWITDKIAIGNLDDSIRFQGAVIPCLFGFGELRRDVLDGLIEKATRYLGQGLPVLFYCENGCDRSPTVCMYFLMDKGMTQEEAIRLIKEKRPQAFPHPEWEIKKSVKIVYDEDIKKQEDFIIPEQYRIYLSELRDPTKLPEGVIVYEGPLGGKYIDSRQLRELGISPELVAKPEEEKKPRGPAELEDEIASNEGIAFGKANRDSMMDYRYKFVSGICKKLGYDVDTAMNVLRIFDSWERYGYDLAQDIINVWRAAEIVSGKKTNEYIKESLQSRVAEPQQLREEDVAVIVEIIKSWKRVMKKMFGEKKITLYRGVADHYPEWEPGRIITYKPPAMSSWTTSRNLAKKFADVYGHVLRVEVDPEDVGFVSTLFMPDITTKYWKAPEYTIITDKDYLDVEVEKP